MNANPTTGRSGRSLELPRIATHFQNSVAIPGKTYERPERPELLESPVLPPHPLDAENVVKIQLGQLASEALQSVGGHFLVIASLADSTAPDSAQGRYILHCLLCSKDQLNAAYRVANGTHRAAAITQPKITNL